MSKFHDTLLLPAIENLDWPTIAVHAPRVSPKVMGESLVAATQVNNISLLSVLLDHLTVPHAPALPTHRDEQALLEYKVQCQQIKDLRTDIDKCLRLAAINDQQQILAVLLDKIDQPQQMIGINRALAEMVGQNNISAILNALPRIHNHEEIAWPRLISDTSSPQKLDCLDQLLEHTPSSFKTSVNHAHTSGFWFVHHGDLVGLKKILAHFPLSVYPNDWVCTAVRSGQEQMLEFLLQSCELDKSIANPLADAAMAGHNRCFEMLLPHVPVSAAQGALSKALHHHNNLHAVQLVVAHVGEQAIVKESVETTIAQDQWELFRFVLPVFMKNHPQPTTDDHPAEPVHAFATRALNANNPIIMAHLLEHAPPHPTFRQQLLRQAARQPFIRSEMVDVLI